MTKIRLGRESKCCDGARDGDVRIGRCAIVATDFHRRRHADQLRAHRAEDGRRHGRVRAQQRPPLRQRIGHRQHQDHVQHRVQRRDNDVERPRRGRRSSRSRRSSTSGSAASCRRAIAPTSTVRTTRITGRSTPTACRTAIRSSSRGAPTARCTGGSSARSRCRPARSTAPRSPATTRCSPPVACRSTSGIRRTATT